MQHQVGIHGLGVYLPSEVRTNDWWPAEMVRGWADRAVRRGGASTERPALTSEGQRAASVAMDAIAGDPFRGAIERRVMRESMRSSDMEIRAAEQAIARAGIDRREIGVLLIYSSCPDYIVPTNAPRVHRELGLAQECLSLATEAACNSFLSQLALAEPLIAAGRTRYALLLQSASFSRLLPYDQPHSAWFGDGATAVVLGPVAEGLGILGRSHYTDGTHDEALHIGVPGRRWNEAGPTVVYPGKLEATVQMVLSTVDRGTAAIHDALGQAGAQAVDVDFFAGHQGLVWLREVTQQHAGMVNARAIDTFAGFGNLSGANLPLILAMADRDGAVRRGDLVAMFAGGAGEVWSSIVLRWGTD